MTNDGYENIRKVFPIFNEIQNVCNELNRLLKIADEQTLSIRFVQANKKIQTPTGKVIDGPPKPHLHMTTFSWVTPRD